MLWEISSYLKLNFPVISITKAVPSHKAQAGKETKVWIIKGTGKAVIYAAQMVCLSLMHTRLLPEISKTNLLNLKSVATYFEIELKKFLSFFGDKLILYLSARAHYCEMLMTQKNPQSALLKPDLHSQSKRMWFLGGLMARLRSA